MKPPEPLETWERTFQQLSAIAIAILTVLGLLVKTIRDVRAKRNERKLATEQAELDSIRESTAIRIHLDHALDLLKQRDAKILEQEDQITDLYERLVDLNRVNNASNAMLESLSGVLPDVLHHLRKKSPPPVLKPSDKSIEHDPSNEGSPARLPRPAKIPRL